MSRFNWWIFNTFGGTPAQQNPETGVWEAIPGADAVIGQSLYESLVAGKTMTLMRGSFIDRWEPDNYLLDFLYGNADTWKHNVSISGGDDKFNYRASLNYSTAQSQLKIAEDGEKKYGARLKADGRTRGSGPLPIRTVIRTIHSPASAILTDGLLKAARMKTAGIRSVPTEKSHLTFHVM